MVYLIPRTSLRLTARSSHKSVDPDSAPETPAPAVTTPTVPREPKPKTESKSERIARFGEEIGKNVVKLREVVEQVTGFHLFYSFNGPLP